MRSVELRFKHKPPCGSGPELSTTTVFCFCFFVFFENYKHHAKYYCGPAPANVSPFPICYLFLLYLLLSYLIITATLSRRYDQLHTADKEAEGHRTEYIHIQCILPSVWLPIERLWSNESLSFPNKFPCFFPLGEKKIHHHTQNFISDTFYKLYIIIM